VLVARLRVRRQRTFSARRIRRSWLRPTAMPASRAAWVRASSATIRARSVQSAGACRAPASRRIFLASPSSSGGRALKNFGTELASPYLAGAPATHTLN
jgi:hypothetical protein